MNRNFATFVLHGVRWQSNKESKKKEGPDAAEFQRIEKSERKFTSVFLTNASLDVLPG